MSLIREWVDRYMGAIASLAYLPVRGNPPETGKDPEPPDPLVNGIHVAPAGFPLEDPDEIPGELDLPVPKVIDNGNGDG